MSNLPPAVNRRVLIIDDNPSIHADFRKIIGGTAVQDETLEEAALLFGVEKPVLQRSVFEIDSAFQGEEGLNKVRAAAESGRPYAMAFVDIRMPPGWDGVETIHQIWKICPDLQVVICTAYSDYSWEDMIRQLGTSESLVVLKKPFDNIEVVQLAHALTQKWSLNHEIKTRLNNLDLLVQQRTEQLESANQTLTREIAERVHMERALRLSEERFSKAFKASPIPLAMSSLITEKYLDANDGFLAVTGFTRAELFGHTPSELNLWEDPGLGERILLALREQMSLRNFSCRLRTKSLDIKDVLLSVEIFELGGEPYLLVILQDLTEQMRLEQQLRQAQKMEAVGQLAAGVAHDFNNILTVIQGNASVLLMQKTSADPEQKPLRTIQLAAERAGKLVRQLLTFSRKQIRQTRVMEMRETVGTVCEMLPRLLGEHISVNVPAATTPSFINADPGMMEQMLMNLAVNARDAMPDGGTLTIATETVRVTTEKSQQNREARAGDFVCLSVSDTGCGMPAEVLQRIFEPFYTTKPIGKGTGLGLATVYGIAKQHEGWVEVQSQLGKSSTFKVFIPLCQEGPVALVLPEIKEANGTGTECVLIAEDEDDVREFVASLLKSHGYRVYEAASGQQALEQWSRHAAEINLLLTDMVMPGGLLGRELAERLVAQKPDLRVIYTSGYSPGLSGKDTELVEGQDFLAKPYAPSMLLEIVRDALDKLPQPVLSSSRNCTTA